VITVIADDITGAAEVAGVGLRHRLKVALDTAVSVAPVGVQLWVIALDTRSMQRNEAINEITKTVTQLTQFGVRQIFKKTDSVLRGHVVAELEAQLNVQGKKAVLLCPANPAGGRKIVDGTYFVNGVPLHQTDFANDPEFPATTSNVAELLQRTSELPVTIYPQPPKGDYNRSGFVNRTSFSMIKDNIRHNVIAPFRGLGVVAQAASVEDLKKLAQHIPDDVIPAGSAAFFEAWLLNFKFQISDFKAEICNLKAETSRTLIICGSTFHASRERVEQAQKNGTAVAYISPLWINTTELEQHLKACASQARQGIQQNGCAIVAVDLPTLEGKEAAVALREAVSYVAESVLQLSDIQDVIIEGGATAFAIARRMGFTNFLPVNEFAPGVVRMKVVGRENLHLTIKPGSYDFPNFLYLRANKK